MSPRSKISIGLTTTFLVLSLVYWGNSQWHFTKADESLNLKQEIKDDEWASAANACYTNNEDKCTPFINSKLITEKVKDHLTEMIRNASQACLSYPSAPFTVINPREIQQKGHSQQGDDWKCAVTNIQGPTVIDKVEHFYVSMTVDLSRLPSSEKKTIYNELAQGSSIGEVSSGNQSLAIEGQVQGKVIADVAVPGSGATIKEVRWQLPSTETETETVFSGSVKLKAQYIADTMLSQAQSSDDPIKATQYKNLWGGNNKLSLNFGFIFDDRVDKKATVQPSTTITDLGFCSQECTLSTTNDRFEQYQLDGKSTESALKDITGPVEKSYKTETTGLGSGLSELSTGKIYWTVNQYKTHGDANNSFSLNKAANETPARKWTYTPGMITRDRVADYITQEETVHSKADEVLEYSSGDALPTGNPQQKIYDSGKVTIHLDQTSRNQGTTAEGSATRTNPSGAVTAKGVCNPGATYQTMEYRVIDEHGPLPKGICIKPFGELQATAFPALLNKYFDWPFTRIDSPILANRDGFASRESSEYSGHLGIPEFHALPATITVIYTDTHTPIQQRNMLINLLHGQARPLGALVQIIPANQTNTAIGLLNTLSQVRDNSWLVVLGPNPAGLKRNGIIIPTRKVNSTLESKSVKMTVVGPGSCGKGYSNLAESFLPLGQDQDGSVEMVTHSGIEPNQYGIWTNNFEYAANSLAQIIDQKIFGCP